MRESFPSEVASKLGPKEPRTAISVLGAWIEPFVLTLYCTYMLIGLAPTTQV